MRGTGADRKWLSYAKNFDTALYHCVVSNKPMTVGTAHTSVRSLHKISRWDDRTEWQLTDIFIHAYTL